MRRECFTAMGTNIDLVVDAAPSTGVDRALERARREIGHGEAIMSRFRPDSELSRLNRERRLERPSPELVTVIRLAMEARSATRGRFDPFVHDALVAAGYDRTFTRIPRDGRPPLSTTPGPRTTVTADSDGLRLDGDGHLDLGGIAKGYIVELAAEALADAGPCLVNAGGDIAVRGTPRDGSDWTVGVPVPDGEIVVALGYGALATSGRDRRTWRRGTRCLHHIIDPATGSPADTDIVRVTAFGPTAVDAETRATALFLAGGADAALAEAGSHAFDVIVVDVAQRVLVSPSLAGAPPVAGAAA